MIKNFCKLQLLLIFTHVSISYSMHSPQNDEYTAEAHAYIHAFDNIKWEPDFLQRAPGAIALSSGIYEGNGYKFEFFVDSRQPGVMVKRTDTESGKYKIKILPPERIKDIKALSLFISFTLSK